MDETLLEYFIAVYETARISVAAKRCNISPQGMSMAISRLEKQIDQPLFLREQKGLVATDAAGVLYPFAKKIVSANKECLDTLTRLKNRTVTVSCAFGVEIEFATPLFRKFSQMNPDVALELVNCQDNLVETAVANHDSDLGLTPAPIDEKRFICSLVYRDPSIVQGIIVADSDPLARLEKIDVKDIEGRPMTIMDDSMKTFRIYECACKKAGIKPNIARKVSDVTECFNAMEYEDHIGVAASALWEKFKKPNARFVPFADESFLWSVYLIKEKLTPLTPEASKLEAFFIRNAHII